jgi:chaperone required for assembly of F1-ATPase
MVKRFYKTVSAEPGENGFTLLLDGRAVKTPARRALLLPTLALAERLVAEWAAQGEEVRPETMPFTRLANSVLDRVADERAAIEASVAAYGGTDLLCYMAPHPEALAARQMAAWQPWLDWAAARYGARLLPSTGLMPREQDAAALQALGTAVAAANDWELAALADCVTITGSLILGLALKDGALDEARAWRLSQLDEAHQAEHWGLDAEAEAVRRTKRQSLADAVEFLVLSRAQG